MAKGTGAGVGTYGALTVANKDYKPIDYGQFAKGFAQVAIDERTRKNEAIDELTEKYGEVFGTDQMEGVGLDNFDATADSLQAQLLADFNALNEGIENGDIRGPEARRRAADLKGQLMTFKQDYDKIASFVNTYNTMDNKSAAMDEQMEKMSRFLEGATIGKDEKGRYVMQKEVNGVVEKQSLDNLKDLLEVRESVDIAKDVAAPIFEIDKKGDKTFSGNTALTTFLETGELSKAQKDVISDFVKQRYDDKDLIDLADQYGVKDKLQMTSNGVALADRDAAYKELIPLIQESVRDQYELREFKEDSATLINASRQRYESRRQSQKNKKVTSTNLKVTDEISGDKTQVTETYATDGRGIEMTYVVQDPGNNMSRAFADSIEGQAGMPIPMNAIKSTRFKKERKNLATGKVEITLGYDYADFDPEEFQSIVDKKVESMTDDQYSAFKEDFIKKNITDKEEAKAFRDMDRKNGTAFMTSRAPRSGSGTFTYVPRTLSEYNSFLAATDRPLMSNEEWDDFFIAGQQNKVKSQAYSKFNKGPKKEVQTSAQTATETSEIVAETATTGTQTRK